jgi:hypothetical protein
MLTPQRIVERFARVNTRRQFGVFTIEITPTYEKYLPILEDGFAKAEQLFARAGFPLQKKVEIIVKGQGWKQRSYFTPNYLGIIPHNIEQPGAFHVFVHELAHWYHWNQVSGGFTNSSIKYRFNEVQSVTPTGGSVLDRLKDSIAAKQKEEAKLLKSLAKGAVVEVEGHDNIFNKKDRYTRKYKVIKPADRTGRYTFCELLNPSPWDIETSKHTSTPNDFTRKVFTQDLLRAVLGLKEKIETVTRELHALYEQQNDIAMGKAQDTRYQELLTDWVPTQYAKENHLEWFAELLTTAVLDPGRLAPFVQEWLHEVV